MLTMSLSIEKEVKVKEVDILPLDTLQTLVVNPVDYDTLLLKLMWKHGISVDMSYIVLAQAKHESWGFTSNIFIENNNFSGMKEAKVRQRTSIGTNRKHAIYPSLEDCVMDYVYYLEDRNIPLHQTSIRKYCTLLKKKGYFQDDLEKYIKGVRKHYNKPT
jgi:hypothetical protein